jgi:hypothetical protein
MGLPLDIRRFTSHLSWSISESERIGFEYIVGFIFISDFVETEVCFRSGVSRVYRENRLKPFATGSTAWGYETISLAPPLKETFCTSIQLWRI